MTGREKVHILVANESHLHFATVISQVIAESAQNRGTGIAQRTPEYIREKIIDNKAIIAITSDNDFAGFCYIESWGPEKDFVANSGLIVAPQFRKMGLAKLIKKKAFELSLQKFPNAKLFGITTSPAVMKINYELGYRPVSFAELTDDQDFWAGCKSCVNYDILQRTDHKFCLCTAMLFDPQEKQQKETEEYVEQEKSSVSI